MALGLSPMLHTCADKGASLGLSATSSSLLAVPSRTQISNFSPRPRFRRRTHRRALFDEQMSGLELQHPSTSSCPRPHIPASLCNKCRHSVCRCKTPKSLSRARHTSSRTLADEHLEGLELQHPSTLRCPRPSTIAPRCIKCRRYTCGCSRSSHNRVRISAADEPSVRLELQQPVVLRCPRRTIAAPRCTRCCRFTCGCATSSPSRPSRRRRKSRRDTIADESLSVAADTTCPVPETLTPRCTKCRRFSCFCNSTISRPRPARAPRPERCARNRRQARPSRVARSPRAPRAPREPREPREGNFHNMMLRDILKGWEPTRVRSTDVETTTDLWDEEDSWDYDEAFENDADFACAQGFAQYKGDDYW